MKYVRGTPDWEKFKLLAVFSLHCLKVRYLKSDLRDLNHNFAAMPADLLRQRGKPLPLGVVGHQTLGRVNHSLGPEYGLQNVIGEYHSHAAVQPQLMNSTVSFFN